MKVLQIGEFTPSHTDVVFQNQQAANERDMRSVIGRFDEDSGSIAFLNDSGLGTKYKSLFESGFGLRVNKTDKGAFYVASVDDVISMNESVLDTDCVEYVSHDEFCSYLMESKNDSILDLDFTHKNLDFTHVVGYVAPDGKFTLRPEIADLITGDFTIIQNDDGESFDVDLTTLTAAETVNIIKFLKNAELKRKEHEISESLSGVQVDATAETKSLLSQLRLARRHGDDDAVKEATSELNQILDSYEKASPSAKGIQSVRNEMKEILKDRDIVAESLSWLSRAGV
ncbi:hypothetical protein [Vibrio parahaemolyticus]|uniref:hypothetical protein n=1 Tax=Vibrio parahaemolyticus TaxID=670 RepID=UPI001122DC59|nr:hypothetical protein [Vibrio parahaemolyticus]TOM96836.1 hypothetical protein CGH65_20790 [Vibrio parahaemolyticus]